MLSRLINRFVKVRGGMGQVAGKNARPAGENVHAGDHQVRPSSSFTTVEWRPGDVVDERYQIEAVMSGSMGKVFIAEHLGWKIKMAIKSPRPEVMANKEGMRCILNEANSWIRMGMHPNIAACYFVLALEGIPHLFIEYVDGGNLMEWITSGKCREFRTALSLAIQFCHGMEYTHGRNMIHRDIKPQNILITKNALLKITDFGIVLNAGDEAATPPGGGLDPSSREDADEAMTIGFRGTPGYASPEQFQDSHKLDKRSDIFSFGICLWLMFCGRKPYTKNFVKEAVPEPSPVQPSNPLPPVLVDLLKKAVAFAPEERFQDFQELRFSLNKAYKEIFRIPCPYFELGDIDLRADSCNNQAVSLFELNRVNEAREMLRQTLAINDVLPEAVYNHLLFEWRTGNTKPRRLLRQIEAEKKVMSQPELLQDLEESIAKAITLGKNGKKNEEQPTFPEFRLCVARKTLEIFRDAQMRASIQRGMLDHLANKQYHACHEVMHRAWESQNYKSDANLTRTYEEILPHGRRKAVAGCQRMATVKGCGTRAIFFEPIPGAKKFITLGPKGEILLRDIFLSENIKILKKVQTPVKSIAVSPMANQLAVGCEDGSVFLWSTTSRGETTIATDTGAVTALAFHPGGKTFAVGGADGVIHLYEFPSLTQTTIIQRGSGAVRSIVFYNKGRDMATGSDDGVIRLWNTGARDFTRLINAHALPINFLSVDTGTPFMASCSADRYVKVWDLSSGMLRREIKAHEEAVSSVLLLAGAKYVVSGCEDDIIKVWDIEAGKCLFTLNHRGGGVTALRPGIKDHLFLSGGENGSVVSWMLIFRLDFNET